METRPFGIAETRLLLTEPLKFFSLWPKDPPARPRFAAGFRGEGGIERIHAEAGGSPHLVQLIAETVIDLLRDEEKDRLTPSLRVRALDKSVISGHTALYELMHRECSLPQ